MSNKEAQKDQEKLTPVPLSVMTGWGNAFLAQGKEYQVKPLKLKHVNEFLDDGISVGGQMFNLASTEAREKLDKWVKRTLTYQENHLSLEDLQSEEHDWDLSDLKALICQVAELSG